MRLWRLIQLKISPQDPTALTAGRVFWLNWVGFGAFLGDFSAVEA